MYTVEFYENDRGVSELWDFLEELRIKSASNKDARIQYKQIVLYIQLLEDLQQGIQIGHRFKGFDPCHRGLRNTAPRCQFPLAQSHRIALLYHCFHDCRHCFRFPDILCNVRVNSCHMLLIIVPGPHIHSPFLASQSSRSAFARSISRRGVFCDLFRNWCSSTNRSPRQQK